jgi:hypothetical protein
MRFRVLAAMAVALGPMAHAQEAGCPLLQKIVAGAPAGFPELKGEELSAGWFDSRLYMTGADDCSVNIADRNLFYCAWGFDAPAAANSLATALSDAAKQCLAGWTLEDTTGRKSSNNLVILKGLTLSGAGAHAGTRVLVFSESFENSQESQVTIEVRR